MQAVVVDDELVVDEQARAVVGPEKEVVQTRVVDADLAAPANGEEIVELGEPVESGANRVCNIDLGIDPGARRREGVEVHIRNARVVAEVDVERQVEVFALESGVGLDILLRPVGTAVDDIDPLLVGRRRGAEYVRQGLGDRDRDVAEAVAVDVAHAPDLGVVGRVARQQRCRQRQRDRRQQLVAIEPERRTECQPHQTL